MKKKYKGSDTFERARLREEQRLEEAAQAEQAKEEEQRSSKRVKKEVHEESRAEAEERLRLDKQFKAEVVKRMNAGVSSSSVSLSALIFEVVEFLRRTRRPASQAQLSKVIRHDLSYNEHLLALVRNNERVKFEDGVYVFRPPYENVHNLDDIERLIQRSPYGVMASELAESYPEAKKDIRALKKSERALFVPNSETKSDVIFPLANEFVMEVDEQLKGAWHQANVIDVTTLPQKMVELGLPVEKSTAKLPRRLKRKKKGGGGGARQAVDRYNQHVPPEYRDDTEWQDRLRRQNSSK